MVLPSLILTLRSFNIEMHELKLDLHQHINREQPVKDQYSKDMDLWKPKDATPSGPGRDCRFNETDPESENASNMPEWPQAVIFSQSSLLANHSSHLDGISNFLLTPSLIPYLPPSTFTVSSPHSSNSYSMKYNHIMKLIEETHIIQHFKIKPNTES
ncbi:hypothetical protein NPIL_520511 [Nephila pilipes]|uniref:Uncharacterized protein n=1 Tax=Nephila pilipes TaxID=299642 RepID=A0A8X6UHL8_NEPPI|nr:hypothetical protein NPIL_520511 [Nephila pilipes]